MQQQQRSLVGKGRRSSSTGASSEREGNEGGFEGDGSNHSPSLQYHKFVFTEYFDHRF